MAKPKKYPRKLRQTLEKIREGGAPHANQEPDDGPFYETLMMQLLKTQTVEIMHVRLDEAAGKIETVYRLPRPERAALGDAEPRISRVFDRRPGTVFAPAPWLDDKTPPSS
jgi:hypothetical protein